MTEQIIIQRTYEVVRDIPKGVFSEHVGASVGTVYVEVFRKDSGKISTTNDYACYNKRDSHCISLDDINNLLAEGYILPESEVETRREEAKFVRGYN